MMTRLHLVAHHFMAEMSFNNRGSTFSLWAEAGPHVQGAFDSNAWRRRVNTALRSNRSLAAESSPPGARAQGDDHKGITKGKVADVRLFCCSCSMPDFQQGNESCRVAARFHCPGHKYSACAMHVSLDAGLCKV